MMSEETRFLIARRDAVRLGAELVGLVTLGGLLGACSSSGKRTDLPTVHWPKDPLAGRTTGSSSGPAKTYERKWQPLPDQNAQLPTGVISRRTWAHGLPEPRLMNPMLPVKRITLHHDGMPSTFTSPSERDAADRLESIRSAHRNNGWGDVGYHYLIDPAGRVWEGRPLTWQGAHVKNQNEGNLGVCVLGNFENQRPSSAQVESLSAFVSTLMHKYNVPVNRVHTHRELASTVCPGRNLQPQIVSMRAPGGSLYLA